MFRNRKKNDSCVESNDSWWIFGRCCNDDGDCNESKLWFIFHHLHIQKWNSNPAAIDDPMKRGFLENYGFFMALGGLYICFPGNWLIAVLHLSTAGCHVLLFLWTAYLSKDNMGDMCEALHFVVLLFTTCSMLISFLIQKSKIENIMRTLGEGVYDYDNTLDKDSLREMNKIYSKAKSAKKFYTKYFVSCVLGTLCFVSIIRPMAVHLLQKIDYSAGFNGINREVAVPCWYPFDTRETVKKILVFIIQYLLIYSTPCVVFGFDLTFLYISEEIAAHLKCVGVTLRNITVRAERLIKLRGEMDVNESLSTCMNHSIQHHTATIRLFEAFNEFYYFVLLLMMTGAALMLCLSCMLFTSNDVLTSSKFTFFFFLTAELNHTFVFCWCGEKIKQVSSDISSEMYDSDWINYSAQLKFYVLMILQKSIKPLSLQAGGFMDASMHTFSNVLSSAYSYFNLLNAVR